jgi:hypothetical protein
MLMSTRRWASVATAACAVVVLTSAPAHARETAAAAATAVPAGVTTGYAVFDRTANALTEQLNVDLQFRSASVVKLLIALDYLWDRGPGYVIPAADRPALDRMLRSSDDTAASTFYARGGYEAVINRAAPRLGLQHTVPPPASQRGYWGYTAITASDTVRIYQYLLDKAPAPVREYIMGQLRQSTRCAADGFDQTFGIPSSFERPWAVKQGWSGFGSTGDCVEGPATLPAAKTSLDAAGLDLTRRALHTTGTVGAGDRFIVVVYTLQPEGTSFGAASNTLTALTRSLKVPGAVAARGAWFGTWSSGVRVRAATSTSAAVLGVIPAGIDVAVQCQKSGQEVRIDGYRNVWWAYLPKYNGYLTNIYLRSPENKLPGVPDC